MLDFIQKLLDDPLFKSQVIYHIKTYHPNEKILLQGKLHTKVYLILKGKVRVSVNTEKEKPFVHPGIADLGPEEMFGEFGLFDDLPASADVVSVDESELIEFDTPTFRKFLQTHPEKSYDIMLFMLKGLIKRLRHADKVIVNLYSWGMKSNALDSYLKK